MAFGTASVGGLRTIGRRVSPETVERVQVWGWVLGTGVGVGALAGAGQIGVAYGLGLLRFAREFPNDGVWSAQLTWVAWFTAVAALAGTAGGAWAARRNRLTLQIGVRIAAAVCAGAGAAVVVPLAALPADSAIVAGQEAPAAAAALAAGLGVLVGVAAGVTALSVRLVAVSLTLLVAVVWPLALVAALPWLIPGDLPEVRVGVLDLPAMGGGSTVALMCAPVVALLICGGMAAAARTRGLPPLPTALASVAAPGLLAFAYLIGGPGTGDRALQTSPYAATLIAVAVGLLISLLVGVARLPAPRRPAGGGTGAAVLGAESSAGEDPFATTDVLEPTPTGADRSDSEAAGVDRSDSETASAEPVAPDPGGLGPRVEPPSWARFTEPPEPSADPEPPGVSEPPPRSPVSAPPAWPAPPPGSPAAIAAESPASTAESPAPAAESPTPVAGAPDRPLSRFDMSRFELPPSRFSPPRTDPPPPARRPAVPPAADSPAAELPPAPAPAADPPRGDPPAPPRPADLPPASLTRFEPSPADPPAADPTSADPPPDDPPAADLSRFDPPPVRPAGTIRPTEPFPRPAPPSEPVRPPHPSQTTRSDPFFRPAPQAAEPGEPARDEPWRDRFSPGSGDRPTSAEPELRAPSWALSEPSAPGWPDSIPEPPASSTPAASPDGEGDGAVPDEARPKASRRLKLPRLGRKSKPSAAAESPEPPPGTAASGPPDLPGTPGPGSTGVPDARSTSAGIPGDADTRPIGASPISPAPAWTLAPDAGAGGPGAGAAGPDPGPAAGAGGLDPGPAAGPAATEEPAEPPAKPPPPLTSPKRKRKGEEEHVDWISSLAGGPEADDEPDTGRRRLRRDRGLDPPEADPPDPPVRPRSRFLDDPTS